MKLIKAKSERVKSTPLSKFLREASSREKKRVYWRVLERATERQERLLAEHHLEHRPEGPP